jgi:SET domain-containing protein
MDAECVEVKETKADYKVLLAKEDIAKGTFLGDNWGKINSLPTIHSQQIGINKHMEQMGNIRFGNHSCSPNAQLVYNQREGEAGAHVKDGYEVAWYLIAARDISKGEEIALDYTLTEYYMAAPFDCQCGSENCLGTVQGFKYLSTEEKNKRIDKVSPVIKELYEKECQM